MSHTPAADCLHSGACISPDPWACQHDGLHWRDGRRAWRCACGPCHEDGLDAARARLLGVLLDRVEHVIRKHRAGYPTSIEAARHGLWQAPRCCRWHAGGGVHGPCLILSPAELAEAIAGRSRLTAGAAPRDVLEGGPLRVDHEGPGWPAPSAGATRRVTEQMGERGRRR
jgi:hypothetical protein